MMITLLPVGCVIFISIQESESWIKKASSEQARVIDQADRILYNSKLNQDSDKIRVLH